MYSVHHSIDPDTVTILNLPPHSYHDLPLSGSGFTPSQGLETAHAPPRYQNYCRFCLRAWGKGILSGKTRSSPDKNINSGTYPPGPLPRWIDPFPVEYHKTREESSSAKLTQWSVTLVSPLLPGMSIAGREGPTEVYESGHLILSFVLVGVSTTAPTTTITITTTVLLPLLLLLFLLQYY